MTKQVKMTDEQVKSILKLEKWSVRCDRLKDLCDRNSCCDPKKVLIYTTCDFQFLTRKHQVKLDDWNHIVDGSEIGIETFGRNSAATVFAGIAD